MSEKVLEAKIEIGEALNMIALLNKIDGVDQLGRMFLSIQFLVKTKGDQFCKDIYAQTLGKIGEVVLAGMNKKNEMFKELVEKYNLDYIEEEDSVDLDAENLIVKVVKGGNKETVNEEGAE